MDTQFPIDKSLTKKLVYVAKCAEDTVHRNNVSIQALRHTIVTSRKNNLLALKAYITECKELEESFDMHLSDLYLQLIEQQLKKHSTL